MPKTDKAEDGSKRTILPSDTIKTKETSRSRIEEYFGNKALRTNPFGANISAEDGYRRVERIVAAVHLMTSHIENTEPLKNSLRSESILLIDYALLVQGELRAAGSQRVRKMQGSIRKLISLISLAGIAGRVSTQNAHILVDALDDLGNFLTTSQRSSLAESVPLTRDDLIPNVEISRSDLKAPRLTQKTKSIKDSNSRGAVREGVVLAPRSGRIFEVLSKGGMLGIKDIVAILPEYSEKMIQRELAAMVESGKVRKIGEKRWSRYEAIR